MSPKHDKTATQKRLDFELAQSTMNKGGHNSITEVNEMTDGIVQCTIEDLADRAKAFEMFRKSYRKNEAMEENRNELKERYARGKSLGQSVNDLRNKIKEQTNQIEQIRKQNAMRGLIDENGEVIRSKEENEIQAQISKWKVQYQEDYNELKELKNEIERIQNLLERCRVKMQKDFE
jgi:kinesin family protein 6/9